MTGPSGPTGPTGATGPRGATGTSTQNLAAVNNMDTPVSGNGLVSLYQTVANNGEAITHVKGSPFISIEQPGLYEVYYQTRVRVEAQSYPVTTETMILFDGETVPHSQDHAVVASSTDEALMSGYALFYAESPSTLYLRNTLENTHFNDTVLMVKKVS